MKRARASLDKINNYWENCQST